MPISRTADRAIRKLPWPDGRADQPHARFRFASGQAPDSDRVEAGQRKRVARRWKIVVAAVVLLIAGPPLFRALFQRQLLIDELQRTKEECHRADDNLLSALNAFGESIDRSGIDGRLLRTEELAFYKSIYDKANNKPAERFAAATARRLAGVAHLELQQPDDARLCFTLATHMFQSLADGSDSTLTRESQVALAAAHSDFASYFAATGDFTGADAEFQSALAITQTLIDERPDYDDGHSTEADIRQARAAIELNRRQFGRAEDDLQHALAIQSKRIFSQNNWRHWLTSPACKLIEIRLQLCDVYRASGRTPEEIRALRQTIDALKQFDEYKTDLHYRTQQADTLERLAAAYSTAGNQSRAAETVRAAIEAFTALAQDYPEVASYREMLAKLEARRATGSQAKLN